ncbi:hypothetical protein GQ600_24049 [Phytophthora cactorum]|nr:hypothetical protein GQ600_24049 [Phytophthora cactorum]
MSNLDEYYTGKEKADNEGDCGIVASTMQINYDSDESQDDGMFGTDFAVCPTTVGHDTFKSTVKRCLQNNMFDGTVASVREFNASYGGETSNTVSTSALAGREAVKSWVAQNGVAVDKLRRWVASPESDSTLHSDNQVVEGRGVKVVGLLSDALAANYHFWNPVVDPKSTENGIPAYVSLQAISQAFTLHKKQHVVFCKVGEALLNRWRMKEYESWGHRTSIVKTALALTGKATTIIGGRTLASFLLCLERGLSTIDLENLDIVVVDEVSMIKKVEFAKLDRLLRKQKKNVERSFRRCPYFVDWCFSSTSPVGAEPLYSDPKKKQKCTSVDIAAFELCGRRSGRCFRTIRDETSGMLVSLPSQPPIIAFVRIPRGPGAIPFCTSPQQFPFVCSIGSTAYKAQGDTLDSLVVVDWKSSVSFANKPQQNYLLVSRVASRHALLAMQPFTKEIARWSRPPKMRLTKKTD